MSPFEILNVSPGSSREQVRAAYRALARRWHPDRFPEGPERLWAEQKMTSINIAYHEALDAFRLRDRRFGGRNS